ncbi:MAG: hypothetical protein ABW007_14970, partial [Chitinophagaceae bacterium]
FCAGDTLPFLAIFSSALIFFCYFFCIKAKKVNGVSEVIPRKKSALPARQKVNEVSEAIPRKKQRPCPPGKKKPAGFRQQLLHQVYCKATQLLYNKLPLKIIYATEK